MAEPIASIAPEDRKKKADMGGSAEAVRELPIITSPGTDNFRTLHSILRELESGQFMDAALLVDAMMRDDRIFSCVHTRVNGLLGTPMKFTAADDRPASKTALEAIEGTDEKQGAFSQMISPQAAADLLLWGNMIGIGIAQIIWPASGDGPPTLKTWHPQFVRWDWGTRSYWLTHEGGTVELPNTDRNPHGDGQWIIFTPYGFQYGWLKGLVRPLAKLYLGRGWAYRDWFRYSEKHGQPLDLLYVPEEAPDAEADQLFRKVSRRNAETAVKLPRASGNGPGYDLKMLEPTSRSWEGFKELLDRLNTDVAVCVLGQNLTTEVQGGSLAAAQVANSVRADYLRADAESLASTLHAQLLSHWAANVYGDAGVAPRLAFDMDPPEDMAADALALNTLATALGAFQMAGAPIDQRALLEQYDVPMRAPLKPAAAPAAPVPPAPPSGAAPPPTPAEPPAAEASAVPGVMATAADTPSPEAAAAKPAGKGRYEDRLAALARQRAAEAMRPALDATMEAISGAKDYEDMKARLLKAYDGMEPAAFEQVMKRAVIMAKLAGRSDVAKKI